MRRAHYLLAFILGVEAWTGVRSEVADDSGWTPITREKVFSVLERKLIGRGFTEDVYNINQNDFAAASSAVSKEVDGPRHVRYNKSRNERRSCCTEPGGTETTEGNYARDLLSGGQYRQPKFISSKSIFAINNLVSTNRDDVRDTLDVTSNETFKEDASVNQYEVTERSEPGELSRQEVFHTYTNKQIDVLNGTETVKPDTNEFTSKLLNVLTNYNIRVHDVLPNYEISRNIKRNSPKQEYYLLPVPIRYSSKVDNVASPLLLVFLSNYGYYLAGRHGLRYSNLHGHLASSTDETHFGSYKMYSDTDSSQ